VALVVADPEYGDVIRGTDGFRKIRVARKGMGKSGGLCISGATKDFRYFSSRFYQSMRKKPVDGGTQRAEKTCRKYFRDLREVA
jgi:hypothetical protein